jgi:hypothetical protein
MTCIKYAPLEEKMEDMRKVVNTYDVYDTLKDSKIEDNEGSDIYTEEDLSDWDYNLNGWFRRRRI